MGKLKVYKASAGSGKTFTLTVEYISMLVKKPDAYRNTLAVTFTNKATEEMKTRIMSQLYGIAKKLPSSEQYVKKIIENTGEKEETVRQRCQQALTLMLHDYTNFRISTIDAFFQTVLRNLAYEMDITPNLKVELHDKQVVADATDIIIDQLDPQNPVFGWLMKYIKEKIEDNKNWNVLKNIKEFGENVLKDDFRQRQKDIEESMKDPDKIDKYIEALKMRKEVCIATMMQYAKEYLDIMDEAGIPEDLTKWDRWNHGANGVAGYFKKLYNLDKKPDFSQDVMLKARALEGMENAEMWTGKTDRNKIAYKSLVEEKLKPLLNRAEKERKEIWRQYYSAVVTLRNINELRLLKTIADKVKEINRKTNRMQLSDTQFLLNKIIGTSDSPFIYEKIGTRIDNIMIDEFQDTSILQWKNFKVLLNECLSHNSENLIVGDVKQSIYRWRNGDWGILNGIEKEMTKAEIKNLDTNYRSQDNVVNFNNAFFSKAAKTDSTKIEEAIGPENKGKVFAGRMEKAYNDVAQKTNKHNGKGFVKATFVLKEDTTKDGEVIKDGNVLEALADDICFLLDKGTPQHDIAIIIRQNKTIPVIAEYFSNKNNCKGHDIKIVSNEAFQLNASKTVNTIVDAMRFIADSTNDLTRKTIEQEFKEKEIEEIRKLSTQPLYDMAEEIFKIISQRQGYKEDNSENAYVCAFFDQLAKFIEDNTADINTFIRQWDDKLAESTIQSDNTDGIRILSIHKSKGLEFDNVIIPYCDWKINQGSTMWCHPKEEPFNQLNWVTIEYSDKLKDSIYDKEYFEEKLQDTVDNLNMLYVAFTRASKNLFFICREAKESQTSPRNPYLSSRAKTIKEVMEMLTVGDNDYGVKMEKDEDGDNFIYSFGTFEESKDKEAKNNDETATNVFTTIPKDEIIGIKAYNKPVSFLQSNDSKRFMRQQEEEEKTTEYIDTGNTIHELLSSIYTLDDIDKKLKEFEQKGLLEKSSDRTKEIISELKEKINGSKAKEWFTPGWQTFNECSILCINPTTGKMERKRPDRVITNGKKTIVIDFKTGKENNTEYSKQVGEYMSLMKNMGHNDIEGYIWYLNTGKIVTVNKICKLARL